VDETDGLYCTVCSQHLADDRHLDEHLESLQHNRAAVLAEKYLNLCRALGLRPVTCSGDELRLLLSRAPKPTPEFLEIVAKIRRDADDADGDASVANLNILTVVRR
jgi:hypothetical protein